MLYLHVVPGPNICARPYLLRATVSFARFRTFLPFPYLKTKNEGGPNFVNEGCTKQMYIYIWQVYKSFYARLATNSIQYIKTRFFLPSWAHVEPFFMFYSNAACQIPKIMNILNKFILRRKILMCKHGLFCSSLEIF